MIFSKKSQKKKVHNMINAAYTANIRKVVNHIMSKNKKWLLAMSVVTMMTVSSAVMVFATPNQQNVSTEQNLTPGQGCPIPGQGPMEQ